MRQVALCVASALIAVAVYAAITAGLARGPAPAPAPAESGQAQAAQAQAVAPTDDPAELSPTLAPPPASPTPAPSPQPSPPPKPVAALSPAYRNPEAAIVVALREVRGSGVTSGSPVAALYLRDAQAIQQLYHLATAEVGRFNADTAGFQSWLVGYLRMQQLPAGSAEVGKFREHLKAQARAAIYQPQSELGQRLRTLEAGADPVFPGSGPEVYWAYLIYPCQYGAGLSFSAPMATAHIGEFRGLLREYQEAQISRPDDAPDFATFLARRNYMPMP